MIQDLVRQRELLQKEFAYEREQFKRQTETTGLGRKVRRGLCWFPLAVGRRYFNSLDQLVIEVTRTESCDVEHLFEPGRPVVFVSEDASGMLHYMKFTGEVSYVEGDRMVVSLPSEDAAQQVQSAERVGVQLYFDEYTYRLQFEALDRVIGAKTGRLSELRDIFHLGAPARKLQCAPVRFPWLNPSQEQAVNEVLWAKDVAIVHGPPGTGKTTTLVEAIYETLHRETQVLVCAQSNMAVDWISEKLADRGVSVLRIGNPQRVTDRMLAATFERRFEAHPDYPQLWAIRREVRRLYDSPQGSREARRQKIARLKDRATDLEYRITEALFQDARVVASTLTGAAHHLLTGRRFATVFIDEAAQALEASCWIAIARASRVIFAGDHHQLPPTLKCPEVIRGGLGKTLMETIVERRPQVVSLLTVQYRMSDDIMRFPNEMFYGGQLTSDPSVRHRSILDWERAIEWVDTPDEPEYEEQQAGDGLSRQNPAEAALTVETLKRYFLKIGKRRVLDERLDVGLISPYRGQVHLLRQLLRRDPFWKPFRGLITVNTVDGFQGQERDIIVISMVRQNAEGQVGFLRDLRRMNVAITRARMKLILIGHSQTLCRHPFYKRLFQIVHEDIQGTL